MKARTGGRKGRHPWPRLVQKKLAEGKMSYEFMLESKSDDQNKTKKSPAGDFLKRDNLAELMILVPAYSYLLD